MKRNGLSLQRPKRQDKVPIQEVHQLANAFYTVNRRASLWSIRRGPMGAFTTDDICNMNESLLALFGGQNKKSINYVGTDQGCHLMKSKKRKVHQKMRKKAEARTEKAKKNRNVRFCRLFEFCIVL